jgi:hypothetical protein
MEGIFTERPLLSGIVRSPIAIDPHYGEFMADSRPKGCSSHILSFGASRNQSMIPLSSLSLSNLLTRSFFPFHFELVIEGADAFHVSFRSPTSFVVRLSTSSSLLFGMDEIVSGAS